MPHYKNGQKVEVGDIAKGVGYNIKHEVVGRVMEVKESDSCNLTIACVAKDSRAVYKDFRDHDGKVQPPVLDHVEATLEYGDCKDFEKIG